MIEREEVLSPFTESAYILRPPGRVAFGQGKPGDIELMQSIGHGIAGNTICALGDAAAWPTRGFLTKFRPDFEAKLAVKKGSAA